MTNGNATKTNTPEGVESNQVDGTFLNYEVGTKVRSYSHPANIDTNTFVEGTVVSVGHRENHPDRVVWYHIEIDRDVVGGEDYTDYNNGNAEGSFYGKTIAAPTNGTPTNFGNVTQQIFKLKK